MIQHTASTIEVMRQEMRELMPVAKKWAYFDHAAVAPLPRPTQAAMQAWLNQAAEEGDTVWLDWSHQVQQTRLTAAKLIGAAPNEVALVPSTTVGINFVAEGYPWQAGDNVVTLDDEFPSNVYPWLFLERLGVETRRVPTNNGQVDLDKFESHCDQRTRVVSISWTGFTTGCRRNLDAFAEIAHRHDALFFVDAIQGLGVFPLDLQKTPIDCLAADGHKWMLGPEGAGIAFIREPWLEKLRPLNVGWNSVAHCQDFTRIDLDFKQSAGRYEGGTLNMGGFIAYGESMKLLYELGVENIAASILDFTDSLAETLRRYDAHIFSPWEPDQRSGIVSFELPGRDSDAVRKHCLKNNVALNCRGGRLRISAHAYNNEQDLERLCQAIESFS